MSTEIRFLGHSAFEIVTDGTTILIDPFMTGNPMAAVTADSLSPDFIIVTHGHGDHVGDTLDIAGRTDALVIANFEITEWIRAQGIEKVHAQHIGGSHDHGFGTVKLSIAHHGSMLPDGSYGGNPCGVLLTLREGTIYHAGDTGLFHDMQLIGENGIDVAILPIGDNFTMGPEDSLRAIRLIDPKRVIPCHYNTFPVIEQDTDAWATAVAEQTSADPVVLPPGEQCSL